MTPARKDAPRTREEFRMAARWLARQAKQTKQQGGAR